MSPEKANTALQGEFVRTQLETGHRMLDLAARQQSVDREAATQSLEMARIAVTTAEDHLAVVGLPRPEESEILQEAHDLRAQIKNFESGQKR